MAIQHFGLAIDWETSGYSVPNYASQHQGISVGAVIFDTADFSIVDSLYLEIKFDSSKYKWEAEAEKIHGLSRAHLDSHGITQPEAAQQLAELVLKYIGTEKVLVLGHRPYFDIAFTDQLMSSIDFEFKYDPTKLDSAAFALTFLGLTNSNELFDAMGMPPRAAHNALEDVIYTLDSIRAFKEMFIAGISHAA